MTATPVEWVLDELGTVVDAQPADHPLWRVDRNYSRIYEGGGTFDMSAAVQDKQDDLMQANFVGARYVAPESEYIGTAPNLDIDEVVGIRIEGYSGSMGHIDPTGSDGVVFAGTDGSLVQQIKDALRAQLKFPDAGRTDVSFTHLDITNEANPSAEWMEYHRYDFDVVFDGFEDLSASTSSTGAGTNVLTVTSGTSHTVSAGDTEQYDRADIDGTLTVDGTLSLN